MIDETLGSSMMILFGDTLTLVQHWGLKHLKPLTWVPYLTLLRLWCVLWHHIYCEEPSSSTLLLKILPIFSYVSLPSVVCLRQLSIHVHVFPFYTQTWVEAYVHISSIHISTWAAACCLANRKLATQVVKAVPLKWHLHAWELFPPCHFLH